MEDETASASGVKQLHIHIEGKVQGVFFRHHVQQTAKRLSLVGWVRNSEDGRVEIIVQGKTAPLQDFKEFCRKGPDAADVKKIRIEAGPIEEPYTEFSIR